MGALATRAGRDPLKGEQRLDRGRARARQNTGKGSLKCQPELTERPAACPSKRRKASRMDVFSIGTVMTEWGEDSFYAYCLMLSVAVPLAPATQRGGMLRQCTDRKVAFLDCWRIVVGTVSFRGGTMMRPRSVMPPCMFKRGMITLFASQPERIESCPRRCTKVYVTFPPYTPS